MSNVSALVVSYVDVLVSAADKAQQPRAIERAIADAAVDMALNGGHKVKILRIIAACRTAKGVQKASGTLPRVIDDTLSAVLVSAPEAGAGQNSKKPRAEREEIAKAYAEGVRVAFTANLEAAKVARKAQVEKTKAAKAAETKELEESSEMAIVPPSLVTDGAPIETDRQRAARYLRQVRALRAELAAYKLATKVGGVATPKTKVLKVA